MSRLEAYGGRGERERGKEKGKETHIHTHRGIQKEKNTQRDRCVGIQTGRQTTRQVRDGLTEVANQLEIARCRNRQRAGITRQSAPEGARSGWCQRPR